MYIINNLFTNSFQLNYIAAIAKELIKVSIYPTKDEFKNATEQYLVTAHKLFLIVFLRRNGIFFTN